MKLLIWLGCAFIYAVIVTAMSYFGITLGGLPAGLLAGAFILLARYFSSLIKLSPSSNSSDNKPVDNSIPSVLVDKKPESPRKHSSQPSRWSNSKLVACLSLPIIVLGIFCFHQHTLLRNERLLHGQQTEALEEEIRSQARALYSQELESYKIRYFDEIQGFLSRENVGYASDNFRADQSIIIISMSEASQTFNLTAHWEKQGKVSYSYDSILAHPPASISFNNRSWANSTSVTVHPNYEGIVTVTFSNDVDDKEFQILILVTN